MVLHERWRMNALSFCLAAEELNDLDAKQGTSARIAPSALCLGFAIELFLKCVLLKAGRAEKELRTKFRHDLFKMWSEPELAAHRQQSVLHAQHRYQSLSSRFDSSELPEPGTFDVHLEHLSRLHTQQSDMALRYPVGVTLVPQIRLLTSVFEALIRAERRGDTIIQV